MTTTTRTERTVPASRLADAGITFELDGRRCGFDPYDSRTVRLIVQPYKLRVRLADDEFADWSWFFDDDHPDVPEHWGEHGPIDRDGVEHAATSVILERVYQDGTAEPAGSLHGIDTLAYGDLCGIGELHEVDDVLSWGDEQSGGDRAYISTVVLELMREAGEPIE